MIWITRRSLQGGTVNHHQHCRAERQTPLCPEALDTTVCASLQSSCVLCFDQATIRPQATALARKDPAAAYLSRPLSSYFKASQNSQLDKNWTFIACRTNCWSLQSLRNRKGPVCHRNTPWPWLCVGQASQPQSSHAWLLYSLCKS